MDEKLMNNKVELTDEEMSKAAGGYEEYYTTDYEMRRHDTIDQEPLFYVGERVCVNGDNNGNGEVVEIKKAGNYWKYKIDYDSGFFGRWFNNDWVYAIEIYGHYICY